MPINRITPLLCKCLIQTEGNLYLPLSCTEKAAQFRLGEPLQRIKEVTTKILSKHTGKDKDEILRDIERDYYMDAEEAMRYGIVDFVVEERN